MHMDVGDRPCDQSGGLMEVSIWRRLTLTSRGTLWKEYIDLDRVKELVHHCNLRKGAPSGGSVLVPVSVRESSPMSLNPSNQALVLISNFETNLSAPQK